FSYSSPHPRFLSLFPYTTLFRSVRCVDELRRSRKLFRLARRKNQKGIPVFALQRSKRNECQGLFGCNHASRHNDRRAAAALELRDRKSTRLNSSHLVISYAVFCL